ncbi:magnesium transporter CorA family protein [Candidatus Woesearchaeota archaeon]|nr:magnesium transporter CorA family protein [Candidatus Woesearchaeota archaeon]
MLKYAYYQQGKPTVGEGLSYVAPANGDFLWLYLSKPSVEELNKIVQDFSLDLKTLQEFSHASHSKRYSTTPFQFVFVDYFIEKEKIKSTKLLFVLGKNFLIVVVPQPFEYYDALFHRLVHELTLCKGARSIGHLLYHFLEEDTEENYDVLEKTEAQIISLESGVVGTKEVNVREIVALKRELFHMTRRFWASAKIIFAIKKGITPLVLDKQSANLLDDIYHTFQHQLDMATAQKEMLSDVLDVYTASLSNRLANISNGLNHTMKFLTALTVILMIPNLLASAFGMNFKLIPFSEWAYGFYFIVGIMAVSLMVTLGYFWRKKWL